METPKNPSIVFRFKRFMQFPKFNMAMGEKWLYRGGSKPGMINDLPPDGQFEFAGGMLRQRDIEILYFGFDEAEAMRIEAAPNIF